VFAFAGFRIFASLTFMIHALLCISRGVDVSMIERLVLIVIAISRHFHVTLEFLVSCPVSARCLSHFCVLPVNVVVCLTNFVSEVSSYDILFVYSVSHE
jgi:hypothetical protein